MDTISPDQVLALKVRENRTVPRDKRPLAKDMSHHLSQLSQRRRPSPLKELFRYIHPGILSFAGGLLISVYVLMNRNAEPVVFSVGKAECRSS